MRSVRITVRQGIFLHSDRSAFCTSSGAAMEFHHSDRSAFCTSSGAAEVFLHADVELCICALGAGRNSTEVS